MDANVKAKFESYPNSARQILLDIRSAIFDVAKKERIGEVTETLKWGEPAYMTKKGSTLRMDWKAKFPDQVSVYFNCNTTLVETFKELFGDALCIVGNREIALPIAKTIPMAELKICISISLRYHQIKHLPLLGA